MLPSFVFAQIYELPNPTAQDGDYFGAAVSISGDYALVGANGTDDCGVNSGVAHVYRFENLTGRWVHASTLKPNVCSEGMSFGRSVALGDSIAVVSSFRETPLTAFPNIVYVFELLPDSSWQEHSRLRASFKGDEGVYGSDVSVFKNQIAVATTGDASSSRYGGAVYIYSQDSRSDWVEEARLTVDHAGSQGVFGGRAVLGDDFLAVTAPSYKDAGKGLLHIFEKSESSWSHVKQFRGLDDYSLSLGASDGSIIVGEKSDGADASGSATIFSRGTDGKWVRKQVVKPVSPFEDGAFGTEVAISNDLALVVGYDEQLRFEFNIDRVVYVFGRDEKAGYWQQKHIVDIGDVFFGSAMDIDGNVALIGRASDNSTGQALIVHLN